MAKSKVRFSSPDRWRSLAEHSAMRQDADGGYVRIADYRELEQAYKFTLLQLERAAKRVQGLMQANRE